jgi:glycerol-3-phosphate acyltransferase PlsY
VTAYVVGGVNGAITASTRFYKRDIRKFGSGNPGLTNFYRVFGKAGVTLVVLIDVAKTVLPVFFGGFLTRGGAGWVYGASLAGVFVILGHCYPVFYHFRGGKGVMAIGAIIWILDWRVGLCAWLIFGTIVAVTRYVSLGAIVGSISVPVSMAVFRAGRGRDVAVMSVGALIVVLRHGANIKRLIAGAENKLSFGKRK